jgi:hypothetical protein
MNDIAFRNPELLTSFVHRLDVERPLSLQTFFKKRMNQRFLKLNIQRDLKLLHIY